MASLKLLYGFTGRFLFLTTFYLMIINVECFRLNSLAPSQCLPNSLKMPIDEKKMKMSAKPTIGRRELLQIVVGGCLVFPQSCKAAIPSMEDYYVGSGAKIKNGPNDSKNLKPSDGMQNEGVVAIKGLEDLKASLLQLMATFDAIDEDISKQAWDDVRREISGSSISPFSKKLLGLGSIEAAARILSLSKNKVKDLDEKRSEIITLLKQLDDYAFSNRVIFFNLEDKKAVTELTEINGAEVGLSEPQSILEECRNIAQQIIDQDIPLL